MSAEPDVSQKHDTARTAAPAGREELAAQRVSDQCAFFLAEQGQPGYIVEYGPTEAMFGNPQDPRTSDYVRGRFG